MDDFDTVMPLATRLAQWMEDNDFRLSQVQGFKYGDDLVVRDCWLDYTAQEIWRKPDAGNETDLEMTRIIKGYRLALALSAQESGYPDD